MRQRAAPHSSLGAYSQVRSLFPAWLSSAQAIEDKASHTHAASRAFELLPHLKIVFATKSLTTH